MVRLELGGACFAPVSSEQTIVLWWAAGSEHTSLEDFLRFCWTKQYQEESYGRQTLEEWFADFHMEEIDPAHFWARVRESMRDLRHVELRLEGTVTRAVRLIQDAWNEVIYGAESGQDRVCFWWYTTV